MFPAPEMNPGDCVFWQADQSSPDQLGIVVKANPGGVLHLALIQENVPVLNQVNKECVRHKDDPANTEQSVKYGGVWHPRPCDVKRNARLAKLEELIADPKPKGK